MTGIIELLISFMKEALLRPKDRFERVKRTASRFLLLPLIAIVAAESVFVAIISALNSVEIKSGNFTFTLIAAANDSFIPLVIATLVAFSLYVGTNVYYTVKVNKLVEQTQRLDEDLRRAETYNRLKSKYYTYLKAGESEKAFIVAGLLVKRFPNEIDTDGDFLESLLSAVDTPQLTELHTMLIEAPRPDQHSRLKS